MRGSGSSSIFVSPSLFTRTLTGEESGNEDGNGDGDGDGTEAVAGDCDGDGAEAVVGDDGDGDGPAAAAGGDRDGKRASVLLNLADLLEGLSVLGLTSRG